MTGEGTVAEVLAVEARWAVVCGDYRDSLPQISHADCAIFDPPYSKRVHDNARTSRRTELPDVADFKCRQKRRVEIDFDHLHAVDRRFLAKWCAERVRRWTLVFCDAEGAWLWRLSLSAAGLNYRRTGEWDRLGGAPQFNGMEPAAASEHIVIAHRPGKRHWNGGGKAARWSFPVVANRLGQRGSRIHPTQKPEALFLALVNDFADPDDLVIDMTCGSGTTGAACLITGRRFIGIEKNPSYARIAIERLRAVDSGSTHQARKAGQGALFS